ncbi:MAG: hypothetical protein K2N05_10790 [Muribaculaceae bacterium]|nr:hypothetical protein [Muribaculaceae bacterium]
MKRIISASVAGVILSLATVSCGPTASEKRLARMQDSIHTADSIAAVEEAAENARREAARQDSIARVDDFRSKIPTFSRLYKGGDFDKYLRNLGYSVSKKGRRSDYGEGEEVTTYSLRVDNSHYCTIQQLFGYEWYDVKVKIVGAPDQLSRFKNDAKAERSKPDFEWSGANPYIEISSNEISWGDGA